MILQGTGIPSNGLTRAQDHILIVGRLPSKSIVDKAKDRRITLTTWPIFADFASGDCTEEYLRAASKSIQVEAYRGDKCNVEADRAGPVSTPVDADMTDRFAQTQIHGDANEGGAHPEQAEPLKPSQQPNIVKQLSSALKPSNKEIPIDSGELQLIDKSTNNSAPPRATRTGNRRTLYTTDKTSFVQLLLSHNVDDDEAKADDLRIALREVYSILKEHDESITLHRSYKDSPNAHEITEVRNFPKNWSQMIKYVHIKNPYSLRPPWIDSDGNEGSVTNNCDSHHDEQDRSGQTADNALIMLHGV